MELGRQFRIGALYHGTSLANALRFVSEGTYPGKLHVSRTLEDAMEWAAYSAWNNRRSHQPHIVMESHPFEADIDDIGYPEGEEAKKRSQQHTLILKKPHLFVPRVFHHMETRGGLEMRLTGEISDPLRYQPPATFDPKHWT